MSTTLAATSMVKKVTYPVYRVQLVRERRERLEVTGYSDAVNVMCSYLQNESRENFVVILLDAKNKVNGVHTVSVGGVTFAHVSAAEVFKAAIVSNACSIIIGHNHPSGNPEPSPEDMDLTKQLQEIGRLLDIVILDHIIVGEYGKFYSFSEKGWM